MNETLLSWIEFEMLLRRLESRVPNPKTIQMKRQYMKEPEKDHHVSVRSHYRYRDYSILNAYCSVVED